MNSHTSGVSGLGEHAAQRPPPVKPSGQTPSATGDQKKRQDISNELIWHESTPFSSAASRQTDLHLQQARCGPAHEVTNTRYSRTIPALRRDTALHSETTFQIETRSTGASRGYRRMAVDIDGEALAL